MLTSIRLSLPSSTLCDTQGYRFGFIAASFPSTQEPKSGREGWPCCALPCGKKCLLPLLLLGQEAPVAPVRAKVTCPEVIPGVVGEMVTHPTNTPTHLGEWQVSEAEAEKGHRRGFIHTQPCPRPDGEPHLPWEPEYTLGDVYHSESWSGISLSICLLLY